MWGRTMLAVEMIFSFVQLSFFLHFFSLIIFSFEIDLLRFQAICHKRRPNLSFLVVLVYFVL